MELARRLGYTTQHVSLLINGKAPVTEDAALRLERVLGRTASALPGGPRAGVEWWNVPPVRDLMDAGAIEKPRVDAHDKPAIESESTLK